MIAITALFALAQTAVPTATPSQVGLNPELLELARRTLAAEVDSGAFPGAVMAVGRRGRLVLTAAVGVYGGDDSRPVTDSTMYDLASLTKVVALTTAVAHLVSTGALNVDQTVGSILDEFATGERAAVTVRHLLTHTTGLPAWRPLFTETESPQEALELALTTPLERPPGERYVYSDLGAIALTRIVEMITEQPFARFVADSLLIPLGMRMTVFRPDTSLFPQIAPTEFDPWRGRIVRGEVHDENAYRLGGVSGHAGLFSTVHDLARLAIWLLDLYHDRTPDAGQGIVDPATLRRFVRRQDLPPGSTRALGWDTPSETGSSAGKLFSRNSFGHTGFTGTSIWIDPDADLFLILLTNRVHPTRDNIRIRRVRPRLADLVAGAVTG